MTTTPPSAATALFPSTSSDEPQILHVSFADDPKASLGAVLVHCDKQAEAEMFLPGYATIGRIINNNNEESIAKQAGVHVGDVIVSVCGEGVRRFAPDYDGKAKVLSPESIQVDLDHKVIPPGTAYDYLLQKIKSIKLAYNSDSNVPPLTLTFERYDWDARAHAWPRFLAARNNEVPAAMQMLQQHDAWKVQFFPIDLTQPGLQRLLQNKVISEIDIQPISDDQDNSISIPPTVYVNYGKLLGMQTANQISPEDVVSAFVIFTERMLATATDPRYPKTCQFIDMENVGVTSGIRADTLKNIYQVFEANYPETLHKMVMYPISTMLGTTIRALLSFVNEKTQKKFVITNSLDVVCKELGWDKQEVEACGGVMEFMRKHEKASSSLIIEG